MEIEEKKSINWVYVITPVVIMVLWVACWFFATLSLKKAFVKGQINTPGISFSKVKMRGFPFRKNLIINDLQITQKMASVENTISISKLKVVSPLFSREIRIILVADPLIVYNGNKRQHFIFKFKESPEFPKIVFRIKKNLIESIYYEDKGFAVYDAQNEMLKENKQASKLSVSSIIDPKTQNISTNIMGEINSDMQENINTLVFNTVLTYPMKQEENAQESVLDIKEILFDNTKYMISLEGQVRKKAYLKSYSGDVKLKVVHFDSFLQYIADIIGTHKASVEELEGTGSLSKSEAETISTTLTMLGQKLPKILRKLAEKNELSTEDTAYFNIGRSQDDDTLFINNANIFEVIGEILDESETK